MAHFTSRLEKGKLPDKELVDLFRLLFSDRTAEYALTHLINNDPFSHALTGNRTTDLWRAWRDCRRLIVQGDPSEAFHSLKEIIKLHPISKESTALSDIEINALIMGILINLNQHINAYRACEDVHEGILRFIHLVRNDSRAAANEIKMMLAHVCGLTQLRSDVDDDQLIGAWIIGRGIDLLLDTSIQMVNFAGQHNNVKSFIEQTQDEIIAFHDAIDYAFDQESLVSVHISLGNCWTETDPNLALMHFDDAVELSGLESGQGLDAAANSANCLMRLHRYDEAALRYDTIESLFETRGDYLSASRVWASECLAQWHNNADPNVYTSLVGAIEMFEEHFPQSADINTLYTLKKYMDPGYLLLISILGEKKYHSYEDLNEFLGACWALLSRDFKMHLHPESDTTMNPWMAILESQRLPLSIMKTALAMFHGTGVVHLFLVPARLDSTISSDMLPSVQAQRLVWVIYGYDRSGKFRFELNVSRPEDSVDVFHFLDIMQEQLSADMLHDSIQVQYYQSELVRLGDKIGQDLSSRFAETLMAMDHLFYMPYPLYNLEEFPLGGLRFNDEWLGTRCTITRSPTLNHLRELLNPNRPRPMANARAVIVAGDPSYGMHMLRETSDEVKRVTHILQVYNFDCEYAVEPKNDAMIAYLNGGAGLVHYIGHGIATNVYEELPLSSGDSLQAQDLASRLTGFRTGFVFLCACEAARIRHGGGGYQIGLASTLVERGAPAVLAFSMPIPETRAYEVVRVFYSQAFRHPFGTAVLESQKQMVAKLPVYAWLALSAYGDPDFRVPSMVREHIPMIADRSVTWNSSLRSYAVLRTENSRDEICKAVSLMPTHLKVLISKFLSYAFLDPPSANDDILGRIEEQTLAVMGDSGAELLSLRAALSLEHAHTIGIDANPIRWPQSGDQTRRLLNELRFVALVGATLFDTRLNGLACALMGRLITWDQGNLAYSKIWLSQGIEKLEECTSLSPYVKRIRDETISVLRQFGG
jgi:CHAT domain-containing protein